MRFLMYKQLFYVALFLLSTVSWAAPESSKEQLDRVDARLDSLGEYASSTMVGKDDAPVAISGDMTVRFKHSDYYEESKLQKDDRVRTKVESALNVGIVVSPSSF